jgi:hypothetical protein
MIDMYPIVVQTVCQPEAAPIGAELAAELCFRPFYGSPFGFMEKVGIGNGRGIKKAVIFGVKPADIGNDIPAIVAQPTIVIKGPFCVKSYSHYAETLYVLRASFNDVLRSVEGFLCPIISAQGTW